MLIKPKFQLFAIANILQKILQIEVQFAVWTAVIYMLL
jgi:hypothetical protein